MNRYKIIQPGSLRTKFFTAKKFIFVRKENLKIKPRRTFSLRMMTITAHTI